MSNKFSAFEFTDEGLKIISEVLANDGKMSIMSFYTFDKAITKQIEYNQIQVNNPKQFKPVGTVAAKPNNTVEARLILDNLDVTSDYSLKSIAIVGQYNDTNFILGVIFTNEITTIPKYDGISGQSIALDVSFAISDTSILTINTQLAGMLTVEDYVALMKYIDSKDNLKADDDKVVHLFNDEEIDGVKKFVKTITGNITGNSGTTNRVNTLELNSSSDLNKMTNGLYLSTSLDKVTTNKPEGAGEVYVLVVESFEQRFIDLQTNKQYYRSINGSVFNKWERFFTVSEMNALNTNIVHKTDNETIDGNKTFLQKIIGNISGIAGSAIKLLTGRKFQVDLASNDPITFDGTEDAYPGVFGVLKPFNGGTGSTTGNAPSASKLNPGRNIQTDLGSISATKFDGTADVKPGVTGILSTANGGTGRNDGFSKPLMQDLASGDDLNLKTQTGFYRMSSNAGAATIKNSPSKFAFSLVSEFNSADNSGTRQTLSPYNSPDTYIRYYANSAWSMWEKMARDATVVHNSGNENIAGTKTFSSAINASVGMNTPQLELMGRANPYIDFHGKNTTADYSSRLMDSGYGLHVVIDGGGPEYAIGIHLASDAHPLAINSMSGANPPVSSTVASTVVVNGGTKAVTGGVPSGASMFAVIETTPITGNNISQRWTDTVHGIVYTRTFSGTSWQAWHTIAKDDLVVHKTGNETVDGNKTFMQTIFQNMTKRPISRLNLYTVTDDTYAGPIINMLAGDAYGRAVGFGSGGLTLIGGGEAAASYMDAIIAKNTPIGAPTVAGTESSVIVSDAGTYIISGYQDGGKSGQVWEFKTNGELNKWINGKSVNVIKATGDAASADKLTTARKINGVAFNGTGDITIADPNAVHKNAALSIKDYSVTLFGVAGALQFHVTDTGVGVVVAGALNNVPASDGSKKTGAQIPTGVPLPPYDVRLPWATWSGITGVTKRTGFIGFFLLKKGSRDIYYKQQNIMENADKDYTPGTLGVDTSGWYPTH